MKKFGKVLLYAIIAFVLIAVIAISYITLALPDVGAPEPISVKPTQERLSRGAYLVNHVVLCVDCHSKRDWSKFAAPTETGALGGGGEVFDATVGFPGDIYVPNITPYNLKSWTDGELLRAFTTGERKDGSAIFPLMPWPYYAKLGTEDAYSVIAYLRTLKPVAATYPRAKLNFPLNIMVHTMPQKAVLGAMPDSADKLKYGAYLVQIAGCEDCHSQSNNGKVLAGLAYAGGRDYIVNGNTVRSANITPDVNTGIGSWTTASFVARFKAYKNPAEAPAVGKTDFQTIMPWYDYSGMTEDNLKAIYTYLKTIKPVKNSVVKFTVNSLAATK